MWLRTVLQRIVTPSSRVGALLCSGVDVAAIRQSSLETRCSVHLCYSQLDRDFLAYVVHVLRTPQLCSEACFMDAAILVRVAERIEDDVAYGRRCLLSLARSAWCTRDVRFAWVLWRLSQRLMQYAHRLFPALCHCALEQATRSSVQRCAELVGMYSLPIPIPDRRLPSRANEQCAVPLGELWVWTAQLANMSMYYSALRYVCEDIRESADQARMWAAYVLYVSGAAAQTSAIDRMVEFVVHVSLGLVSPDDVPDRLSGLLFLVACELVFPERLSDVMRLCHRLPLVASEYCLQYGSIEETEQCALIRDVLAEAAVV